MTNKIRIIEAIDNSDPYSPTRIILVRHKAQKGWSTTYPYKDRNEQQKYITFLKHGGAFGGYNYKAVLRHALSWSRKRPNLKSLKIINAYWDEINIK